MDIPDAAEILAGTSPYPEVLWGILRLPPQIANPSQLAVD